MDGSTCLRHLTRSRGVTAVCVGPQAVRWCQYGSRAVPKCVSAVQILTNDTTSETSHEVLVTIKVYLALGGQRPRCFFLAHLDLLR